MSIKFPENIQCYLVGGAVRDQLLGIEHKDHDYVLTGAEPGQLIELGFKQVGKDFPVFLHPETSDEYALARKERKSGQGYTGFSTDFNPAVTLEEDLARRDLTINAMAMDNDGHIIDPFNGQRDLQQKILRHVTDAFAEDPLRVLRVARFAARFPDFSIAEETRDLMCQICASGELEFLTAERVWLELEKTFQEARPERFFEVLNDTGGLEKLFPELAEMIDIPQRADYHAEGDVFVHTLLVLRKAAELANEHQLNCRDRTAVLAAALWHDVGKAKTPYYLLYDEQGNMRGKHHGHEDKKRVYPILENVFSRLRIPRQVANLVRDVATLHLQVHKIIEMKPETVVDFFDSNSFHNKGGSHYVHLLGLACKADSVGRLLTVNGQVIPVSWEYPQLTALANYYEAIRAVSLADWINQYRQEHEEQPSAKTIRKQKRKLELAAINSGRA